MRYLVQLVLGVVLVGAAFLVARMLIESRPEPRTQEVQPIVPVVRALRAEAQTVRVDVETHGTVTPHTTTALVAQVAGVITGISPALAAGGFFAQDEELLAIDRREYELAVTAAAAEVAQRRTALEIERAEAEVAIAQWQELGRGEAPPLVRREPQVAQAEAALAAAEARLQRARLDLERCSIRAPYDGRVQEKLADVGQYVTPGAAVARVYATDHAEVRLPIAPHEVEFLDLPLDHANRGERAPGPEVTLRARFAGRTFEWPARIVRTEGQVDPRTRMVYAVARVDRPYARAADGQSERPPLAVGMFVAAAVHGRTYQNIVVLPRSVLRPGGRTLLVIDAENRLFEREVDILRSERERVLVRGGIAPGERVCLTPLELFSDGMRVEVVEVAQ